MPFEGSAILSPVTAIAWSPRSSDSVPIQLHFATAGTDGVIRIFDGTLSNSEEDLLSYSHNIFFLLLFIITFKLYFPS